MENIDKIESKLERKENGIEKITKRVDLTRNKARDVLEQISPNFEAKDTVDETLKNYPWGDIMNTHFSQEELANINQDLDPRSCLGRAALSFAIIDKFFIEDSNDFSYGEVHDDWFWQVMMSQWNNYYKPTNQDVPEGWVDELMVYEEPHAIVLGEDNYQFEPLSVTVGRDIKHPKTESYPSWHGVTSALMVSEAIATKDPQQKMEILKEAEEICPGTALVKQNMIEPLILLGKDEEAFKIAKELIEIRPNARTFYLLETLFGEKNDICDETYGPKLWGDIKKRLEDEIINQ